jgi:hypothetical protein
MTEATDARLWYNYSFMLCDTENFIGKTDTGFVTILYNAGNPECLKEGRQGSQQDNGKSKHRCSVSWQQTVSSGAVAEGEAIISPLMSILRSQSIQLLDQTDQLLDIIQPLCIIIYTLINIGGYKSVYPTHKL